MKKHLFFLILLLSGMAGAQVVNIPDPAFKNYLLTSTAIGAAGTPILINTNGDNEIQVSEALAVRELEIDNEEIESMAGIESFTNLRVLDIQWALELTTLDITALSELEELYLGWMDNLDNIYCSGLANLNKSYRRMKPIFMGWIVPGS